MLTQKQLEADPAAAFMCIPKNPLRHEISRSWLTTDCTTRIGTARMHRVKKGSGMAKLVFRMNQSLDRMGDVIRLTYVPA
jgi:uncharacterized protein YlaI